MNKYNEIIDMLESIDFDGALVGLGAFIFLVAIIALVIVLVIYVFQSIALHKLAEKNNIPNAWLAWIPVGNMYILGKIGFEIYAEEDKKNEVFTWVLLGCSAVSVVIDGLSGLANLGVLVFSVWAYYNIFNKINKPNAVLFTILSAVFRIGGVILFFNRYRFTNQEEVSVKEDVKQEKETVKANVDTPKYCASCGNKVTKASKFCSKCGNKLY